MSYSYWCEFSPLTCDQWHSQIVLWRVIVFQWYAQWAVFKHWLTWAFVDINYLVMLSYLEWFTSNPALKTIVGPPSDPVQAQQCPLNYKHCVWVCCDAGTVWPAVRDDTVQDYTVRANVLATSGTALEQGSKIGLGQTKTVTAMFSNHQVIVYLCVCVCLCALCNWLGCEDLEKAIHFFYYKWKLCLYCFDTVGWVAGRATGL